MSPAGGALRQRLHALHLLLDAEERIGGRSRADRASSAGPRARAPARAISAAAWRPSAG